MDLNGESSPSKQNLSSSSSPASHINPEQTTASSVGHSKDDIDEQQRLLSPDEHTDEGTDVITQCFSYTHACMRTYTTHSHLIPAATNVNYILSLFYGFEFTDVSLICDQLKSLNRIKVIREVTRVVRLTFISSWKLYHAIFDKC